MKKIIVDSDFWFGFVYRFGSDSDSVRFAVISRNNSEFVVLHGYIHDGQMYASDFSQPFFYQLDAFRDCVEYLASPSARLLGTCYSSDNVRDSLIFSDFRQFLGLEVKK